MKRVWRGRLEDVMTGCIDRVLCVKSVSKNVEEGVIKR